MISIMKQVPYNVILCFLASLLMTHGANSQEVCSRIATVNYQNVLVDTNSNQKGEGLRYYLDKDPKAKSYLNKYQKNSDIRLENVLLGTVGTSLTLAGILATKRGNRKKVLMTSGASLLLINFLVAKTMEHTNENYLMKAIKEYNKRNLPKIFFNPSAQNKEGWDITLSKNWEF